MMEDDVLSELPSLYPELACVMLRPQPLSLLRLKPKPNLFVVATRVPFPAISGCNLLGLKIHWGLSEHFDVFFRIS